MMTRRPWRLSSVIALTLSVLVGCGGGGDGAVAPTGSITISVSPGSLTLVQGQQGSVTVTLSRSGGFAGSVSISAQGLPSGVTIAGTSISSGSTSVQLTVDAGAAATVGTASVTIRGTGTGVSAASATVNLTIEVSAENGFNPSISVASLDIEQGASQDIVIEINRAGGFDGTVTFSARDVPNGLTVSFDPVDATGSQTTLTVDVDPGLAAGQYTITIDAQTSSAGAPPAAGPARQAGTVIKSFSLTLNVMPPGSGTPPGFSLGLSPTTLSIQQGGTGTATLDVTREGGFTDPVQLSTSGEPAGMMVTPDPASVTGASADINVTVGSGVTPGSYPIVITGTDTDVDAQMVTLSVNVTSSGGGGTGNVSVTFCEQSDIPVLVAAKNGTSGTWTRVSPNGMTYSFDVTSMGGVAWVTETNGHSQVNITYGTTAYLQAWGMSLCRGNGLFKTLMGSVSGLGLTDQAMVSVGGATANVGFLSGSTFTVENVFDGLPVDLLAVRQTFDGMGFTADRAIRRQGLNLAPGATIPDLNLGAGSSEAFDLGSGSITFGNLGTDQVLVSTSLSNAANIVGTLSAGLSPGGMTQSYPIIPAGQRVSGDLHLITGTAFPAFTTTALSAQRQAPTEDFAVRTASVYVSAPEASQMLDVGPEINDVTVSVRPSGMLGFQYMRQAEYDDLFLFGAAQTMGGSSRGVFVFMQSSYLGTGDVDVELPDLSGVDGWNSSAWDLMGGSEAGWSFGATGTSGGSNGFALPQDGMTTHSATRGGTITP